MEELKPGAWVRHEANTGRVEPYVPGQHATGLAPVGWLSNDRKFADVVPTLADVTALQIIPEPHLGPSQAAAYLGMTPTNIYRAKRDGWFGGQLRQPFWATPTELDNYAAAPKARSGPEAAALARTQQQYGRIITEETAKKYRKRLAGGSRSRKRGAKKK